MDKFDIILDEVKKQPSEDCELHELVKRRISDYLNFSADKLLEHTDAFIFGGAVRDSIADLEIHDVDILALPRATQSITSQLSVRGFTHLRMSNADIISMYDDIKIINEPWTFIKGDVIVQVIRPVIGQNVDPRKRFTEILGNVDLSACGVAYHKTVGVIDTISAYNHQDKFSTIEHCQQKLFITLSDNIMHMSDRISHRKAKLLGRGWKEIQLPVPELEPYDLPF